MAAAGRYAIVTQPNRVLWNCRHYSKAAYATKSSRFTALEAQIEKFIPQKLKPLWHHEAGLKSIFFWAPSWKWVLVGAGLADYSRPADKLSPRQAFALAGTGFIWARWSLVIIPKNWNLFSVNLFLGLTGCMQLIRIFLYHRSIKHQDQPHQGSAKLGCDPHQETTQYLPPVAPPGTMVVYAPGVKPLQGILEPQN